MLYNYASGNYYTIYYECKYLDKMLYITLWKLL